MGRMQDKLADHRGIRGAADVDPDIGSALRCVNPAHVLSGRQVIGRDQTWRSACIFLISAIARAGERPFGHTLAQFMMVWQR